MFSEPEHVVEQLGIHEGEIVVDFGCGVGMYTLAVAKAMHGTGRVYAIDVEKEILTRLQNSAREEGYGGCISVIWGNLELPGGTKLRDGMADMVIIANVLFQNEKKLVLIAEARRVLRHGGRVVIIDWMGSFNNLGPRPHDIVTEQEVATMLEHENFTYDRHVDAGPHHYGIVYRKGVYQPQLRKQ